MNTLTRDPRTKWWTRPVVFLIVMIAFTAAPAPSQDLQQYLAETRDMVREGMHQEALERFRWFHANALERQPSMAGVRLSHALSYWRSLGDVYPPALAALLDLRDETVRQLREDPGDRQLFADLIGLNRVLEEERFTIQVFERLLRYDADLADQHRSPALTATLIQAGRPDLLVSDDLLRQFEFERAMLVRVQGSDAATGARTPQESRFIERSLELIATGLSLGQEATAKIIQAGALELTPSQRLRDAVP
jgi:hypothetical protein